MTDDDRYSDPQSFISCPYDIAHSMPKFRMGKHLIKCRKQHQEMTKEIVDCYFNITHKVPRVELQYHLTVCSDRESFHTHRTVIGAPSNIVTSLKENVMVPIDIPTSENWDQEVDSSQNIIDSIKNAAENRKVLQNFTNEPPSVRKSRREVARKKMNKFLNEEENAMKDPETYSESDESPDKFDDSVSMISYITSASKNTISSDMSYNTAITSALHRLEQMKIDDSKNKFQPVKSKKSRGRSKASIVSEDNENGAVLNKGFGRGRVSK